LPCAGSKQDDQDFVNDQGLVGKLVRLIRSDTPDLQYQLLVAVRKHFGIGGEVRIKYTLPPLVIMALELARTYAEIADQVHYPSVL
jgi:vacuolar protein sorting-associated protein 35